MYPLRVKCATRTFHSFLSKQVERGHIQSEFYSTYTTAQTKLYVHKLSLILNYNIISKNETQSRQMIKRTPKLSPRMLNTPVYLSSGHIRHS